MKRIIWIKIGRVLVAVYIGILLMLMLLERFLVYPVPPATDGSWNATSMSAEEVEFESEDGTRLHGWYFEHASPRAHLLFCHGNGEHLGYIGREMQAMSKRMRVSVLVFDYRGYGRSQGKPFERGILQDGEAAHHWLAARANIRPSSVVLHGRSLGGGVAVHLASEIGARALILERSFHSMVAIGAAHYPWLPVRWVMRNRYPSAKRIVNYNGPLLQLHGTDDVVVPIESARKLFEASPSKKKSFIEDAEMGHNGLAPVEFTTAMDALLESI